MDIETFRNLPTAEVSRLVHKAGSKVCAFPIKGTRRWFMLEHPSVPRADFVPAYLEATTKRSIQLYQQIFDHGLNTLLIPCFSPDVMARGENYMQMAAEGLSWLAIHPDYLSFYQAYNVRVRFYGDYRRFFDPTPYAYLSDLFDEITARTRAHDRYRLFFGLFAHDPTETVANLAIRYYVERGQAPDKRTLIRMYYGEYVEPVDLFIGFGKFRAFDMPLVTTGREDLYFTVSPSLHITERQLRDILYDHLYSRTRTKVDLQPDELRDILRDRLDTQTGEKADLPDDLTLMREFYRVNLGKTLGIGSWQKHCGFWYPLPQVQLPANSAEL